MGEIIKKVGEVNIKSLTFDVELNEPLDEIVGGNVHIQTKDMRMQLPQVEFYKMVATIKKAEKELKSYKKFKGDR